MSKFVKVQPFKTLFLLTASAYELICLPFTLPTFILRFLRPIPQWTFQNSLMNYIVARRGLYMGISGTDVVPWDLSPGLEGPRFQLIERSAHHVYQGILAETSVQPGNVGGVWHPQRPDKRQLEEIRSGETRVVLHFHGGAFARGTYRDSLCGVGGSNLAKSIGPTLCAAYRLTLQGNAYPAALQDAVTSYSWLVHEIGAKPENIVVSGDSAGGNLAIALLRYTETNGRTSLPAPGSVLLWSPWTDSASAVQGYKDVPAKRWKTDFLSQQGLQHDMRAYVGEIDPTDPFINPVDEPFRTKARVWVHAGGVEVFRAQISRFVDNMKGITGNHVEYSITPYAMHDIFLAGWALGFKEESERQVELAAKFIK